MSATDTMRALLWMRSNDAGYDPAEFIVRAARPSRWPSARFGRDDVDRAARAIRADEHYLNDVAHDAMLTCGRAGMGQLALHEAKRALR